MADIFLKLPIQVSLVLPIEFPRGFIDGYENLLNFKSELANNDKNYSDNYDLGYKFRILHLTTLNITALNSANLEIKDFNENNLKTVQLLARVGGLK